MGKLKEFTDKVWYGTGAVGLDLSYGMFNGKLQKYQTNILHLDTGFLLGLTAAARVWDGINDPMMGTIVDNTSTKFGRYRPWVMGGACMNAVILFLLFFNPLKTVTTPSVGLYIYAAVTYVLWGMTNTTADIPYWSMVPSFTTDPNERSILATVARTFSGLGQGIIQIGAPLILNALGNAVTNETGGVTYEWTQKGYTVLALGCSLALIFFAFLSMSHVKETVPAENKEKFSFKRIFDVVKTNDQLRIFMLFAMLSNAGIYTTSGVQDYFFSVVMENTKAQSIFSLFGAAGSILGLAVIPVMMKFTSRRRTYQFSLSLIFSAYLGMFLSGSLLKNTVLLNIFYLINQIGSASMFISQTVFLSDIVDYGEVKTGVRRESVTFSMKGFLQKMAYTVETVILNATLKAVGYNSYVNSGSGFPKKVKTAVSAVMYIVPPIFFILSFLVFTFKFKLHGQYMEDITAQVTAAREKRLTAGRETESNA